jgi:glycosyltransferase involved in cell wall biosynthesis
LFLAKTGRGVKNLKGAIAIAKQAHRDLDIIGGWRLSLNRHIRYHGLIGGEKKNRLLRSSSALLFPVTWDEPFGLAPIEALYHGAPVIATPYGALPEIVTPETGVLSNRMDELVAAATDPSRFDPEACHDRVMKTFTSEQMTNGYLEFYEKVLAGQALNPIAPHRTRESYTTPHPIFP